MNLISYFLFLKDTMFKYHTTCVVYDLNCLFVQEFYTHVFASARICLGTTVKKYRGVVNLNKKEIGNKTGF